MADVLLLCECCALVLQTDADDERRPVVRKALFPLFHSQRSFARSSSERERPLVATAMVHQSHTHRYSPLTHTKPLRCMINNTNHFCSSGLGACPHWLSGLWCHHLIRITPPISASCGFWKKIVIFMSYYSPESKENCRKLYFAYRKWSIFTVMQRRCHFHFWNANNTILM